MLQKVLVVDDEPKIVKLLRLYLEQSGYRVISADDGNTALTCFDEEHPDFVILDLNLPGVDGLDVCREIRRESQVPILMLTARMEESDKLIGLDYGADDYVVKPFSPREVVARVRTILRRSKSQNIIESEAISVGSIQIDLVHHTVTREDHMIDLTPTEFDILVTLARQPGRVFTRLQLLEQTQGAAFDGYERTVDAHIKNLRSKLEVDPKQPALILTVFGLGYKLALGQR